MATINRTIKVNKTAVELRNLIDEKVLPRPEISVLLSETRWEGNVLYAQGPLGKGTLTLEDGLVVIHIELTIFGSAAKTKIEETLTNQLKRLGQ